MYVVLNLVYVLQVAKVYVAEPGVCIVDCFYIALFSALEQTHCAHM